MPQPIASTAAPTKPLSRSFRRLALLFLLLVSGFAVYAWQEEKDEELNRLSLLSDFAARSADAYFEFYHSSVAWLGEELLRIDASGDPIAASNLLLRFRRAHPELVAVNLVRPDGRWLASSALQPGSELPDYRRIPHIWSQFSLTLQRDGLHVMRVHRALLTGAWVIPLQYAVRNADGEVMFVLSAGLPLSAQQTIWRDVRLLEGASIGLVRNDGYFQSLRPTRDAEATYEQPADCPVAAALAANPRILTGQFYGASNVCGPGTRFGAYHRLSHYPMAAFVGMPRNYLWAQWWQRVRVPFALFLFSAIAGLGVYRRGHAQQLAFEEERTRSQAALMRMSRRNESILQGAGEGIYGLDTEGRVMFANQAAATVLGYEVDELVGQYIHPLVHHTRPDGAPYPAEACPHYAALRLGVRSHVSDEVFWTKSGAPVPIEYTSTPIHENGHLIGAVVVFRDITERKRHEAMLAGEKQVLEMIARSGPLPEVLAHLARLFESQTARKAYCCVLLVDTRRERLFVGAAPNLPEALVQQLDGLPLSSDAPACAAAAAGGRVTIAGFDTEGWGPEIRKIAQEHGLRSCWSVPIRAGGEDDQVLGTFNIYCADARPPTSQEIAFVERAAQTAGIAIQKKRAEDRLGYLAHRDALTGLPNRILLQDRLHHAIVHASRRQLHLGLLYVDLDRFKHVNDTLGHAAGDQLLVTVARRLEESVRNVDTVARQGGDEFVVILEDVVKEDDVSDIAQKILTAMAQPLVIGQNEVFVTGSIGISVYPRDGKDPAELLKNADVAMYRAKEKGRNNFEFFTEEMNYSSAEHFAMSNRLRHALERQEFRLYYQPRVDVRAGRITGAEALLRWEHPELGLVLPSKFIPLLEDTGLIVPVGEWVLRTACEQNRAWRQAGYAVERVAVNISGLQFRHGRLESTIARVLAETGLDPHGLEIELTESLIMQDVQATTAAITRLKKMGVGVSVDDFGTGYSSLSYLKRFPIDTIKIDRLFIKELTTSAEDAAIAKALIDMAHSLKIKTVAEGVETEGQLGYLRRRRCDEVQGNYFSAPVPAEQFAKLLASRRRPLLLP